MASFWQNRALLRLTGEKHRGHFYQSFMLAPLCSRRKIWAAAAEKENNELWLSIKASMWRGGGGGGAWSRKEIKPSNAPLYKSIFHIASPISASIENVFLCRQHLRSGKASSRAEGKRKKSINHRHHLGDINCAINLSVAAVINGRHHRSRPMANRPESAAASVTSPSSARALRRCKIRLAALLAVNVTQHIAAKYRR